MRGGDPKSLGDSIHGVVDKLGGKGRGSSRAAMVWKEVVGDEVLRHTHVVGIRGGELLVHVDSPAWATELSAMSEQLTEGMKAALGENRVRSIRFTVSKEVGRVRGEEREEREAARGYGGEQVMPKELSQEERERIECLFAGVKDPNLRAAAVRAVERDLEWKKGVESAEGRERGSGDL